MEITEKDIGRDIDVNGKYGEIVEICKDTGNIVVEFPDKKRKVILKEQLKLIRLI